MRQVQNAGKTTFEKLKIRLEKNISQNEVVWCCYLGKVNIFHQLKIWLWIVYQKSCDCSAGLSKIKLHQWSVISWCLVISWWDSEKWTWNVQWTTKGSIRQLIWKLPLCRTGKQTICAFHADDYKLKKIWRLETQVGCYTRLTNTINTELQNSSLSNTK